MQLFRPIFITPLVMIIGHVLPDIHYNAGNEYRSKVHYKRCDEYRTKQLHRTDVHYQRCNE